MITWFLQENIIFINNKQCLGGWIYFCFEDRYSRVSYTADVWGNKIGLTVSRHFVALLGSFSVKLKKSYVELIHSV